jgi:hypothetical protein
MFVFGVDLNKKFGDRDIYVSSVRELCWCLNKESDYVFDNKEGIVFISADSRDLPLNKTKYDIFEDISKNISQCFGVNVLMNDVKLYKI